MAISWNVPALINKIATDIPGLNTLLKALLKWDTSGTEDIPTGAKRLTDSGTGKQIQEYDGASWGSVGKLMHDTDMLDGKHAATGQTANTIPVRDANGSVPGNITGNAATATEASSLASSYTVPIANGGTGATDAGGARQSLGTNNAANITTGTLATARGGTGRTDGKVTDVHLTDYSVSALSVGAFGPAAAKSAVSADTLIVPGTYYCTGCTVALKWPTTSNQYVRVTRNGTNVYQEAFTYNSQIKYRRWSTNTGSSWTRWYCDYGGVGTTTIYLSKDGADTNTGLSADSPLLTVAAALQQAAQIGSTGTITFRFGPGDWGNVGIYGDELSCTAINIYPTTGGTSTTEPENMPTFGNLSLLNGQFQIGNIEANYIYARHSYVYVRYYNKINRATAETAAYMHFAGATAIDIKYDSAGTAGIFTVNYGGFIYLNEMMNLASGLANSAFIYSNVGQGRVYIGNSFSYTGTYTGKKFNINANADLSFNYDPTKKTTDSLPGSGNTTNGGLFLNGVPQTAVLATKATQLNTARTIAISGGATGTATSFNGTANITIPVTALDVSKANAGTLAVGRGGTGGTSLDGAGIVTKTGNQTIGGTKTFSASTVLSGNNLVYQLKASGWQRATAPSAAQNWWPLQALDKAGKQVGGLYYIYGTDKALCAYLMCYKGTTNDTTRSSLRIGYDKNGDVFTYAPTPGASSNDTNIATTAWVRTYVTGNSKKVASKGTCTTNGTWSITGLTVGFPLFILYEAVTTPSDSGTSARLWMLSGARGGVSKKGEFELGTIYGVDRTGNTDVFIVIPTATTVSIGVMDVEDDRLIAYQ